MEDVMTPYEIRQRGDGSIDYNNYYARPIRLTTPAMRGAFRKLVSLRGAAIVAATLCAVFVMASASDARLDCAPCATLLAAR
jgi:hypothetical protein